MINNASLLNCYNVCYENLTNTFSCLKHPLTDSSWKSRYCLPRRERNPLYQSTEDLTDRGLPTRKQSQDYQDENGGYDTLRTPNTSFNHKFPPLDKDRNGFLFCLSPTDPPVPLRPVPSPRHVLLQDQTTAAGEMSREMTHGGHRKRPNNLTSGLASVAQPQRKDSPVYEMPDKFVDIGRRHRLKPPGSSTPPTLPGRRNLEKKARMSGGLELPPAADLPPAPQLKQRGLATPCTAIPAQDLKPTEEFYEEQGEEESGEKMKLKEFASIEPYAEIGRVDKNGGRAPTTDDARALYANVKKVPKDGAVAAGPQMSRKESVQSEPPEIPPYCGGGEDGWLCEELATPDDNVEDKDSDCPPSTPFIN